MTLNKMKIIECPRDAIQGITKFIPTEKKVDYINSLLSLGFDTIDFGSFVSPSAVPQMKDTAEVLEGLNKTNTKLLVVIGNLRGANEAVQHNKIDYLGFPSSISEEFLKRNLNTSIAKSFGTIREILSLTKEYNKELVVYVSMAFGNPYDEEWYENLLYDWVFVLVSTGVKIISLSDTTGNGNDKDIKKIFEYLITEYPDVEFGLHAHTTDDTWFNMVDQAYEGGCRRFDSVIDGKGGHPLSGYEMLGNLRTRKLIEYLNIDMDFENLKMIY